MKVIKKLFMLGMVMLLGVFLYQPAFAQLAPAAQPVLSAGDLVLVDADIVAKPTINETLPVVASAVLPGHLNFTRMDYIANKIILAGSLKSIMPVFGNIREVATIIKGPSLGSKIPVTENNSLDSTGSLTPLPQC